MRFLPLLILTLFLSACSNNQLNVVDSLTSSAQNDGVGMNPSRWFVKGHPLQTTYVSLNGQLGLKAGQVCVASSYRSPFKTNCLNELGYSPTTKKDTILERKGKLYQEYYSANMTDVENAQKSTDTNPLYRFIKAVSDEKLLSASFVKANTDYLSCLIEHSKGMDADSLSAVDKQNALAACAAENTLKDQALTALNEARLKVDTLAIAPNRMVYNWAENTQWENGVVIQSEANSANMSSKKNASGYTVVNGLVLERYQMSCSELQTLKEREDAKRLKIVTMTLAAEELYYNANEETSLSLNAAFSFTDDGLKMLKAVLNKDPKDLKLDIQTTINTSSSIASKGYLTAPIITLNKYDNNVIPSNKETFKPSLTYYAVLSDVGTLACD